MTIEQLNELVFGTRFFEFDERLKYEYKRYSGKNSITKYWAILYNRDIAAEKFGITSRSAEERMNDYWKKYKLKSIILLEKKHDGEIRPAIRDEVEFHFHENTWEKCPELLNYFNGSFDGKTEVYHISKRIFPFIRFIVQNFDSFKEVEKIGNQIDSGLRRLICTKTKAEANSVNRRVSDFRKWDDCNGLMYEKIPGKFHPGCLPYTKHPYIYRDGMDGNLLKGVYAINLKRHELYRLNNLRPYECDVINNRIISFKTKENGFDFDRQYCFHHTEIEESTIVPGNPSSGSLYKMRYMEIKDDREIPF